MADSDAGVAIYWDFENVHACLMDDLVGEGAYRSGRFRPQDPLVDIDPVAEYAATFGRIVVHRAYGNWQYFARYRDELQAHAVDLGLARKLGRFGKDLTRTVVVWVN